MATSRISSWSDSKPPNVRLVEPADDVDPVALADGRREVRPAEGDPVEDVEPALERQLGVPARGLAAAGHGQAEDRDERLRIADPARREAGEAPMEGVVDVERRAARGRSRAAVRGSRGRGDRRERA